MVAVLRDAFLIALVCLVWFCLGLLWGRGLLP